MQCKCSRPSFPLAARCATFVALVAPLSAHAQQFVLVDQTYTATKDNTQDSHFTAELKSGIPADLRAPTNYSQGSIHVNLEILEAPSSEMTLYNICLENSSDYACLPYVMYAGKGTKKADPDFADLWQYDKVDWTKGVSKVSLILKDKAEQKVQGDAKYYPYKAHVTLTLVADGSTFDPTKGNTDTGAAGAPGMQASGGRGGATAGRAGSSGSGGKSGTSTNPTSDQGGSSGSATNSGSNAATAGKAGTAGSAAASGTNASKPLQPGATTSIAGTSAPTSNAAVSGVDAGLDDRRSISSQLENTSGCSVAALGTTRARSAWPLLAFGLLLLRRRRQRR